MIRPASATAVIDAQVHAYEHDHPGRPWVGTLAGPPAVTGEDMVAAMDAVGVDGALLVSPWSMYRYDASYALEVHARHADRFALIKPFDFSLPTVEDDVAEWAATPGAVGVRVVFMGDMRAAPADRGLARLLNAAAAHGLPVNMLCWGQLPLFDALARAHPHTRLVLDHLGLTQTFAPPAPARPFADLDRVLALARHDNVAIKITGACTLSQQPFPYADIWPPLARIIEAFGIERCLWGTDWTRAVAFLDYAQGVEAFRLHAGFSDTERAALMGGNLAALYGWTPAGRAAPR